MCFPQQNTLKKKLVFFLSWLTSREKMEQKNGLHHLSWFHINKDMERKIDEGQHVAFPTPIPSPLSFVPQPNHTNSHC